MASSNHRSPATQFGSRTDVGSVRDHNEDSLIVAPPLFVVADGMGGHAAGEVASEIAVSVIAERAPKELNVEALGQAVEEANLAVITAAHNGTGREGMGTTCTAAMLEGERLILAQVGDSRAYLLHQGNLQQLTRDHSLVADLVEAGQITPEEARVHPQRSAITRALGSDPRMKPDLYEINVRTGDRLLLCSDGLSSMVEDDEIRDIMARINDPQRCASSLVNAAIGAGGYDNVTTVVVDIHGNAERRRRRFALKTKVMAALFVVLVIGILAGAGYGFNYWTTNSAYLAAVDNKVAVYHGVPGEILGMSFSKLDHVTDVNLDDLQPGLAKRLRTEGITTDNLDAANKLVESYEEEIDQKQAEGAAQAHESINASDDTQNQDNDSATSSQGNTSSSDQSSRSTSQNQSDTSSNDQTTKAIP